MLFVELALKQLLESHLFGHDRLLFVSIGQHLFFFFLLILFIVDFLTSGRGPLGRAGLYLLRLRDVLFDWRLSFIMVARPLLKREAVFFCKVARCVRLAQISRHFVLPQRERVVSGVVVVPGEVVSDVLVHGH